MQVISKIEPTSPSSTSSTITPKSSNDLMQAITKALRRGQESANQLRILSNKRLGFKVEGHHHHHHDSTTTITKEFGDDFQRLFDHHSWVTLNSFDNCISMIKSYDFDQQIVNKKRKVDDHDDDHSSKSEEISDAKDSKERRGCYKRRKTGQTWTVEATNLIDDGYGWRKYGQKEILHTKYPRNYYRCTHKHDQNCLATKQVQQISANPTKYTIIYNGQHTCNNLQKTSSIVIDDDSLDEKSSFFLSFATNNNHPTPKHGLNSSMFPSTTFQNNTSSTTMIKQDHTLLVKEESSPLVAPPPPPPQQQQQHDDDHHCGHDHHHVAHKQYPSSSSSSSENNHPSSSSDITSTGLSPSSSTPVSELSDVISPTVTYSSTPGAFELMDEEIFLGIMNLKQDFFYPHLDALLNE